MRPSGQLVTSDTIKSQLSWRLPKPVLPADPMLTGPILPMLVRLSLPNMMAMLAMAVSSEAMATAAKTAATAHRRRSGGKPSIADAGPCFAIVSVDIP